MRQRLWAALLVVAAAAGAVFVAPVPAGAAVNDSFSVATTTMDNRGVVRFVDYGEGKPGGGNNDDYIVCEHNISQGYAGCWLWVDDVYQGGVWSGGGANTVWEPYSQWNVGTGDKIAIKVCWNTTKHGPSSLYCNDEIHYMVDG